MENVCRALLSTAIRRCRTTQRLCRITIAVKISCTCKKDCCSSPYQISISDTGPAINPQEFLASNRNIYSTIGTYFTSPQRWDGVLKIMTTDAEKAELHHYQMTWGDASDSSTVLHMNSISKGNNNFSGTEVSLLVHGDIEEFISYIKDLCQKISILKMPTIALELYLERFDNSKSWCENLFMSKEGIILPNSMSNIDRLSKGIVDYRTNYMQRLDKQAQQPFVVRESFKVGKGATYNLDANKKMEIVIEVVLVLEISKATSKPTEPIIKSKVLYYEDYFPSAVTISVIQALESVRWLNYGLSMKSIEMDNTGNASIEWEGQQTDVKFDIVVHKYKTECIKKIKKISSESFIIKDALGIALDELKERNPELFLSQHACKIKTYVPDLSRSISGLIMSSNDMAFIEECAQTVGISAAQLDQEVFMSCINKKILDIVNMTDRNSNQRNTSKNIENTCKEPFNEEQEDEDDNEHMQDEYRSIWDFL